MLRLRAGGSGRQSRNRAWRGTESKLPTWSDFLAPPDDTPSRPANQPPILPLQSLHPAGPPLAVCEPAKDLAAEGGRFRNRRTGAEPALLHFNGGGKDQHPVLEKRVREGR